MFMSARWCLLSHAADCRSRRGTKKTLGPKPRKSRSGNSKLFASAIRAAVRRRCARLAGRAWPYDSQDYLKSARLLHRTSGKTPGHPETLMSAIYNCEKTHLAPILAPKPRRRRRFSALIARQPAPSRWAFYIFRALSPEADNYGRPSGDNPSEVRKMAAHTILPRIAAAVAKQKDVYKSNDWKPRFFSPMLVHAASASGKPHAQALQLSQFLRSSLKQSDDLLFAAPRGIALQRANKRYPSRSTRFKTFLRTFPKSRMTPGVKNPPGALPWLTIHHAAATPSRRCATCWQHRLRSRQIQQVPAKTKSDESGTESDRGRDRPMLSSQQFALPHTLHVEQRGPTPEG